MIPLHIPEAALTMTYAPSADLSLSDDTSAFSEMFDQMAPSKDGDDNPDAAPSRNSDDHDIAILMPVLMAKEAPNTSVKTEFMGEAQQSQSAATAINISVNIETDVLLDMQRPLSSVARIMPQMTLAQSMLEGRFPSQLNSMSPQPPTPAELAAQPHQHEFAGPPMSLAKTPVAAAEGKPSTPSDSSFGAQAQNGASSNIQPAERAGVMPLPDAIWAKAINPGIGAGTRAVEAKGQQHALLKPDVPTSQSTTVTHMQTSTVTTPLVAIVKPVVSGASVASPTALEPLAELGVGIGSSERALVPVQTHTTPPTTTSAETARHVAGQIAVATSNQAGRTTEIALNPEELGRVRLSMTAVDQTITLNVLAERPETTDLLRRHIDALAQEFRALGYDNIAFSFGDETESNGERGSDTDCDSGSPEQGITPAEPHPITGQNDEPDTGLNLWL